MKHDNFEEKMLEWLLVDAISGPKQAWLTSWIILEKI
jgi:hypothetical protein